MSAKQQEAGKASALECKEVISLASAHGKCYGQQMLWREVIEEFVVIAVAAATGAAAFLVPTLVLPIF